MIKKSGINILVVAVITASFALKIWGINFGLPKLVHYDEGNLNYTVFYSASHMLKPNWFIFPMLLSYLVTFCYGVYYFIGLLNNFWTNPNEFFIHYLNNPTVFLISGRLMMIIISTITLVFTYFINKKLFGKTVGFLSLVFLAFAFLYVKESRYIKEYVLLCFFGLFAYYCNCLIAKKGLYKNYLFSGILLGLLWATKYLAFIYMPMIIVAHLMYAVKRSTGLRPWHQPKQGFRARNPAPNAIHPQAYTTWHSGTGVKSQKKFRIGNLINHKIFALFFLSFLVFLLLNPYFLITTKNAVNDFILQYNDSLLPFVNHSGQPVWLYYLTYHMRYGLGTPLLVISIISLFYLLIINRRRETILLTVTPLTMLLTLFLFGGANFDRYILPVIPFLTTATAIFLLRLTDKLNHFLPEKILLFIFCLLLILPNLIRIIKFNLYITAPDTRILALKWVEENIPADTKIANEGVIRAEYPSLFSAPLSANKQELLELIALSQKHNTSTMYLTAFLDSRKNSKGYFLKNCLYLDTEYILYPLSYVPIVDVAPYLTSGYNYLIHSSWQEHEFSASFQQSLATNYELVQEFLPDPVFLDEPHAWRLDYKKLDGFNILKPITQGPVIKIYKKKGTSPSTHP